MATEASAAEMRCSRLSVVVPCYNEDAVLLATHGELRTQLAGIPSLDYELIYVDDGSVDHTFEHLRRLQAEDRRVRVVRLSRNFGQEVAIAAGLAESTGDAAVLIDADLQDPPALIAEMVAKWRAGAQVVYAVRVARHGEAWPKRWLANSFYHLFNRVADRRVPHQASDFRLLDRAVVRALLAMPERDRLTRAMISWAGFRQAAVRYERRPRLAGDTKYPLAKRIEVALDGLLSFSLAPLRLATWLGSLAAGLALVGGGYAFAASALADGRVSGVLASLFVVLCLGGLQLLVVGALGEYIGRIYSEVKRRPMYFVEAGLGFAQRRRSRPIGGTARVPARDSRTGAAMTAATGLHPSGGSDGT